MDQSKISRQRCAYAFGNANCRWVATSCLTWRIAPTADQVKAALDELRREWRKRWLESPCGWVMEIQERGAPHFHLVHAEQSNFGKACMNGREERVIRRGVERRIVRGGPDFWLVSTWLSIIGATGCEKSMAFNRGGIIELYDNPDGAGCYFAKDSCKEQQKELPDIYSEGLGRWWWLNPRWKMVLQATVDLDLSRWPWDFPVKHVWDARAVAGCVERMSVPEGSPMAGLVGDEYAPTLQVQMNAKAAPAAVALPRHKSLAGSPCECGSWFAPDPEDARFSRCQCGAIFVTVIPDE